MTAKFIPTEQQRRTVRALAQYGIPQPDIAKVIEISPATLRLHFRAELDRAAIEANAKVAAVLFEMATSGQHPAATFFWLKCRARWRETDRVEHTGPNGTPLGTSWIVRAPAPVTDADDWLRKYAPREALEGR